MTAWNAIHRQRVERRWAVALLTGLLLLAAGLQFLRTEKAPGLSSATSAPIAAVEAP